MCFFYILHFAPPHPPTPGNLGRKKCLCIEYQWSFVELFDTVMRFIDDSGVEANKMSVRAVCPNIGL